MYSHGKFRVGDVVRPRKTGEIVTGEFHRARTISQYASPVSCEKVDGQKIHLPFGYYKVREVVEVFEEREGTFNCCDFDLVDPLYKIGDKVETANYWGDGPYKVEEIIPKGHRIYLRLAEFPGEEKESIHFRRVYAAQP